MKNNSYLQISKNIIANQGLISFIFYLVKEIYRLSVRQFIFSSYSQNWEDLFIAKQFPSDYTGFYIDIGAHHPFRLSNTYRLYCREWSGIAVEPNPYIKPLFLSRRPRDIYISTGIGPKKQLLNFYNFIIPAISTFSQAEAQKNQKHGYSLKEILKITMITPSEIYKLIPKSKKIDFLNLDTEGWDYKILKLWNWDKYPPSIICVEKEKYSGQQNNLLVSRGYQNIFSNSVNTIYKSVSLL